MSLRRKASLAGLGIVLGLLLSEWAVSKWYPVGVTSYRLDPELLHVTRPLSRRIQVMPERAGGMKNLVEINSQGFRGPELQQEGPPRIAVFGDSLVMAENVPFEESFPARLQDALGGRYELISAGVSGYGPDQAFLRWARERAELRPALTLLVLCATNDFGDLLRNKLFRLNAGVLEQTSPQLDASVALRFKQASVASGLPALWRAWLDVRERRGSLERERLESATEAPDWIPQYLEQAAWEYQNTVLDQDLTVYSLMQDVYDADMAIQPNSEAGRYKRELLTALLARWKEECESSGSPLACIVVPSAVDIDPEFRIHVSPTRFPSYSAEALTNAMVECAEAAGVPVLELQSSMKAGDPAELFVGWDDIHWNARGIDLAAQDVSRWLQEEKLLPAIGE